MWKGKIGAVGEHCLRLWRAEIILNADERKQLERRGLKRHERGRGGGIKSEPLNRDEKTIKSRIHTKYRGAVRGARLLLSQWGRKKAWM